MQPNDDLDLLTQYYRLRGQHIYYQHVLDNYRHYGPMAPLLDQFTSLCSGFIHDLGNGLNAIRGRLERLFIKQTNSQYIQVIAQAKALCDGCGWRLYALQEVSPSPPIHPEPVNLAKWTPKILDVLTAWKPPSVQVKFHTTEPRLIVADYDNMLRLALLELLLNAFSALPNGGQISVFLKKLDSIAEIKIADTGPGFSASDLEQCFDLRFTTGSHRYGLGLYIARKVIEKHRGTLALRSESGQGSQALIHLPIGNPEPDWDDESALVLALESLSDSIASQKLEIDTYRATSALSHEKTLAQLSNLFGYLGASTIQFLENSLANIRRLLVPLFDQMTGEAADHIRFILDKCAYCGVLLGNVRALNPDLTLRPVPLDLNQIASKVVQLMTWRAQSGTRLHLVRSPSLPRVYADALLIAVALLNLLRNALDAAGQNGRVGVQTLSTDDVAIVRFINTGNTIPPSDDGRARIFDLDYTTRPGRAFGLGLYVAQSIVARHNGSITMSNMPQSRVRLELALPIKRMREVQKTNT